MALLVRCEIHRCDWVAMWSRLSPDRNLKKNLDTTKDCKLFIAVPRLNIFSCYNFRSLSVVEWVFWITTCRKQYILLQHSYQSFTRLWQPRSIHADSFFFSVKLCGRSLVRLHNGKSVRSQHLGESANSSSHWRTYGFSPAWLIQPLQENAVIVPCKFQLLSL